MKRILAIAIWIIVAGMLAGWSAGKVFVDGDKVWIWGMVPAASLLLYATGMTIIGSHEYRKRKSK